MIDDSALWATDSLLDSLALGEPAGDDRGLQLLSALVVDVSTDLPTATPLPDELRRRRSRLLRLVPRTGVALVAAAAVVSTGGVAAASVSAGPTSSLFPLHQVLTGQPQLDGSQRQALEVRDRLQSATKALAAGKVERAQKDVSAAAGRIAKVAVVDGRRDLAAQWVKVNQQVKAHVATLVVPAKPAPAVVPTPDHSATVTHKPTVSPVPVVSPSPTTHSPAAPAPVVTTPPVAPTSAAPSPTPVAPTSPQPSVAVAPLPIDVVPSAVDTPDPSGTPTKGGHHGKGSSAPPSAAQGSPVDPIVITPTATVSAPPTQTAPAESAAPVPSAAAPSAAAPSASAPPVPVVVVVPPPSTPPLP